MQIKHLNQAKPYEAPNHRGYCSLRLFGLDAGGPKQFTVGLSHFFPGGGAGHCLSNSSRSHCPASALPEGIPDAIEAPAPSTKQYRRSRRAFMSRRN